MDDYQQNHYQFHWNEQLNENWATNIGLNYTKGQGFLSNLKTGENAVDFNLIVDGSDIIVRRWLDNDFYVANLTVDYQKRAQILFQEFHIVITGDHLGKSFGSQPALETAIRDRFTLVDAKKTDLYFLKNYFLISVKN